MKFDKNTKILIVGLGLIGGGYAEALTKKGYEVGAITRKPQTIDYAIKKGIIKHGNTEITKEYVGQFDLIIFSLYPHVFVEWLEKYGSFIKEGAIVTDVTGVKVSIINKVKALLPKGVEFIGAHPMAGKEVYGIENADSNIFLGANYIITPSEDNSEEGIEVARKIGEEIGFRQISILTPEKHDEMIGFLSQLTHCIAVSLMTCKQNPEKFVDYTGDSFRDLTRIAKINEDMWSELFVMNKETLLSQMDLFINNFKSLRDYLANEDIEKMKEMMRLSTNNRKYFDK